MPYSSKMRSPKSSRSRSPRPHVDPVPCVSAPAAAHPAIHRYDWHGTPHVKCTVLLQICACSRAELHLLSNVASLHPMRGAVRQRRQARRAAQRGRRHVLASEQLELKFTCSFSRHLRLQACTQSIGNC